jgi:hypothetical protein
VPVDPLEELIRIGNEPKELLRANVGYIIQRAAIDPRLTNGGGPIAGNPGGRRLIPPKTLVQSAAASLLRQAGLRQIGDLAVHDGRVAVKPGRAPFRPRELWIGFF